MDFIPTSTSQINLDIPFADFLLNGGRLDGLDNDAYFYSSYSQTKTYSSMTNYTTELNFSRFESI